MAEVFADAVDYPIAQATSQTREGRRQSPGQRPGAENAKEFYYPFAVTIWHGGVAETIPVRQRATVWGTSGTTFDLTASRWISFTVVGSGRHYICTQQDWKAIAAANQAIGIEYHTRGGWRRYQPKFVATTCFNPSLATISLVAGGTSIAAGGLDVTFGNTDGPLGTNTLANPTAIAFNPADGCIYFIDAGTSTFVRKLDPVTKVVSTTAINSITFNAIRASGGFTIDQNSEYYFLCQDTTDSNNPFLTRVSADGATETQIWHADAFHIYNQIGGCTDIAISKDGVYAYFGGADLGYGNGAVVTKYQMIRTLTHPGSADGTIVAGNNQTSSLQGGDAPFINTQGEGVDPLTGRVDGAMSYYTAPSGELYTWSEDTWMVRRIAADFSRIDSVTNHVPLDASGFPQPGFGGDGLPAFTLGDNNQQFGSTRGIAIDACGNVLLGDGIVRYVDTSGILNSLLGDPLGSPATWPTATPQLVSACFNPFSMQRICYDPIHAAVYFTAFYWDGANISENAIFKVEGA